MVFLSKLSKTSRCSITTSFNFALKYANRKVQEGQAGLKFKGTHHLRTYADNVNLLGDIIETIKKNTETLIDANNGVGLEINLEKTKYVFVSRHQNVGQNQGTEIANRSFENVTLFKYLGDDSRQSNFDSGGN
jgi:hypothetical protein